MILVLIASIVVLVVVAFWLGMHFAIWAIASDPARRPSPLAQVDAAYMSAKQKMLDADIQRRYQKARR